MTDHAPFDLSGGLGTALRDRVADEHPDLDRLLSVSTRAGTRLRRRRTAAASVGVAAVSVAMAGIVGSALGGGGTAGSAPGFATQPDASAPAGETVTLDKLGRLDPPSRSVELELLAQALPVHVDPSSSGWGLGTPTDDKFSAHKEGYVLSVNVRPRSDLASWSGGDPDRPASQVVHTGENYFVTVLAGPEVPPRIVDELTAALRYDPVWKR